MASLFEVRWHSRGGQGAKTASGLLAEAVASVGKFIQGFPEYGPERMGAPMLAFNRISDAPIRVHAGVTSPDAVLVLDPTLVGKVKIAEGLKPDGVLIINSKQSPAQMRARVGVDHGRVLTLDADGISVETIGRAIPNTPMMGALVRATGLMELEQFLEAVRGRLEHKFRSKPEVIEANITAIRRAYEEVREE